MDNEQRRTCAVLSILTALALVRAAPAGARGSSAALSLNRCENAVRKEADKFERGSEKAMTGCLQAMSRAVLEDRSPPTTAARAVAGACVKALRKLQDSRGGSLADKMAGAITARCDPASPGVKHVLADVTGKGLGLVDEPIKTADIDAWCAGFGGDGSIDTVAEWIGCLQRAQECAALAVVSAQYPRALEWLRAVIGAMGTVRSHDPGAVADAVAAATAAEAVIAGGNDGDEPRISCGAPGSSVPRSTGTVCGDGVKNGVESCDGADLGGSTCTSLGFLGGTLACGAGCRLDTSSCKTDLCGDGTKNGIESCDGADLGGQTCAGLGFLGGTLACGAGCRLDTSGCATDLCGDGVKNGIESCDGADLAGQTCASLGFAGGTLACGTGCRLDTSGCVTDLCGDGAKNGIESCDGSDFGGRTCASLGFGGGTLACTASCALDLTGCTKPFPETGQMTCWDSGGNSVSCAGTGYDGDVRAGVPLSFTDNGDGTITDTTTGLMWEKQSDDGGIHDKDTVYSWTNAFTVHLADLNASGGFAGHTDWRIPNIKELQTIVDYEKASTTVPAAFNTGCAPGCTVLTCSCITPSFYWSSTTSAGFPVYAWYVNFGSGSVSNDQKVTGRFVRAVRGGS